MTTLQVSQDTIELQNKIISLKLSLAKVIEEREYIIWTIKPAIEADFQIKIGVFQLELLQLEVESRRLKSMIHRIQADINRNKKPNIEFIEKELQKEFQKWYKQIEVEAEKIKYAKERFNSQMTQAESSEFKKLFRELVKKLHPDINPNLGEKEKDLWLQVIQTYNRGDLDEMRALSVILEDTHQVEISNINELKKQLESFTSRESGFLFNNVVFVVMCFAVFWGTIFPVISEAVRGTKITVGAPFFNQINIPIGLILLFLTGVGPLLAWRNTSKESLIKNFTFPLIVAFIIVGLLLALDITGNAMMTLSLSGFVFTTIVIEFWRGIRARTRKFDESIISAFIKLIQKNRSRYGGYISHLGIVLMFVGFSGHAFDIEDEWGLQIGAKETVGNYEIELDALSEEERPNHYAYIANLNIYTSGGEFVTDLHPEKRIYFHRDPNPDKRQPHSELDIYSTIVRDIYSIFTGVDPKNQVGYFKIMINPLVQWVWIGSYFLIIGTVIAMWPVKRGKNELE